MPFLYLLLSCLLFICGQNSAGKKADAITVGKDTAVLKIYVDNSGVIFLDNQATSLADLYKRMQGLNKKKSLIYYSRDNTRGDPPKEAMQVMEVIVRYSLPIRFYTDKTFTDIVDFK